MSQEGMKQFIGVKDKSYKNISKSLYDLFAECTMLKLTSDYIKVLQGIRKRRGKIGFSLLIGNFKKFPNGIPFNRKRIFLGKW